MWFAVVSTMLTFICKLTLIWRKWKSLSCVRLFATPWTLQSMEFSRPEHWSGLPFPSPMRESEKWKWSRSVVSDSSRPHGLQPTRLLCPWDFPGKSTGVGCHCHVLITFFFFSFWPYCEACRVLVPWPGIKLVPPAVKTWSPNHCSTKEVL